MMMRRVLVVLAATLALLFGGLTAPAAAHMNHWCGH